MVTIRFVLQANPCFNLFKQKYFKFSNGFISCGHESNSIKLFHHRKWW